MITIKEALEQEILATPYLQPAMAMGLINLSALARTVKPKLEKKLYKKQISEASLIMALKRLQPKLKTKINGPKFLLKIENFTVRSNIVEINVANSTKIDVVRNAIAKVMVQDKDVFFSYIQGVRESTFVISKNLSGLVLKHLEGRVLARIENLASISLSLPPEYRGRPGMYYSLLKILAWHNINLVEVISNYNEFTLVFESRVIDKAFSLLKSLTV